MIYGLDEHESLAYIRKREVSIHLSRSNFYSIKKRISQNEAETLQEH